MCFVGIITDENSKKYLDHIIKHQDFFGSIEVIYINEKNIDNLRNVKFDTIIINQNVEWIDILKKDYKYIIINSDLSLELLNNKNSCIITYGFNSKSTITISSNTDDNSQICIQRNICADKENVEQQEIVINKTKEADIYDIIIIIALCLIYDKKDKIGEIMF